MEVSFITFFRKRKYQKQGNYTMKYYYPRQGFWNTRTLSEGSFVLMTENQLKMFLAKRHLLAQVPERSWEQLPAGLCLFPFLPSVFLCYLPFESGSL